MHRLVFCDNISGFRCWCEHCVYVLHQVELREASCPHIPFDQIITRTTVYNINIKLAQFAQISAIDIVSTSTASQIPHWDFHYSTSLLLYMVLQHEGWTPVKKLYSELPELYLTILPEQASL